MAKKKKKPEGTGFYRSSSNLVIREGATFSHRCAICNRDSDIELLDFNFERHNARYMGVGPVDMAPRGAADFVKGSRYTGPVSVEIPLCGWHRKRRLLLIALGGGVTAIAVAYLAFRFANGGVAEFDVQRLSIGNLIAVFLALVGLAIGASAMIERNGVWFRAMKYYDRYVWLRGAGQEFLRGLPELENYEANSELEIRNLSAAELIHRAGLGDL